MKAKFTKGDWVSSAKLDSSDDVYIESIVDGAQLTIAKVYGHEDAYYDAYYDAALIAAAPDLYSVLSKIVNSGAWYYSALEIDTYESGYDGEQLKQMALNVLAKARGE